MATDKATHTLPMHTQQQSPLFRLPAELRNAIYELVFENGLETIELIEAFAHVKKDSSLVRASSSSSSHDSSDVPAAAPPSAALVRTCQQACRESKAIFQAAFESYWQKEFIANVSDSYATPGPLFNISEQNLSRIHKLTFLALHRRVPIKSAWKWSEGGWQVETVSRAAIENRDTQTAVRGADKLMQDQLPYLASRRKNAMAELACFVGPFTHFRVHQVLATFRVNEHMWEMTQEVTNTPSSRTPVFRRVRR